MATLTLSATTSTITFTVSGLTGSYVDHASADLYFGTSGDAPKIDNILFSASEISGGSSFSGTFTGLTESQSYRVRIYVFDSGGSQTSATTDTITTQSSPTPEPETTYYAQLIFQPGSGTGNNLYIRDDADSSGSSAMVYFDIPYCNFTPPDNYAFDYWVEDSTGYRYDPGESYAIRSYSSSYSSPEQAYFTAHYKQTIATVTITATATAHSLAVSISGIPSNTTSLSVDCYPSGHFDQRTTDTGYSAGTTYSCTFANLTPETNYTIGVSGSASGTQTCTGEAEFTTLALPTVTIIATATATTISTTISNIPTGTSKLYVDCYLENQATPLDTQEVTSPSDPCSVTFSGLTPGTTYVIGVAGFDSNNVQTCTGRATIQTEALSIKAYVWDGTQWCRAIPWVYTNGGWQEAIPFVYTGDGWG